ncbi:GNAT family N-acetyltransferase [Salegentibacter sp.]|uniref:GNAT family N-acetyltransferase n=1 Tax=Salegentibacter sp. TaxID=1903072 RepID=UPI003564D4C3
MDIKHKETDNRGMFYLENKKGIYAELTYVRKDNDILTIDHIEVDEELEGKGFAGKLLHRSVEYAREENLKIDPLCPYAEVQFQRNESYQDVKA